MRRIAQLSLLLLLAWLAAPAVGNDPPTTGRALLTDRVIAGHKLHDELVLKLDAIVKSAGDPHMKESYDNRTRGWAALTESLTADQVSLLIEYFSSGIDTHDQFNPAVSQFVLEQAIDRNDVDFLKRLLAVYSTERIGGRYLEWVLEKKTGKSVEILLNAYEHAKDHHQAEQLEAPFRRAFSQVDGSDLIDDQYVLECAAWCRRRRHDGWRINENYHQPPAVSAPGITKAEEPSPDRHAGQLLFENAAPP